MNVSDIQLTPNAMYFSDVIYWIRLCYLPIVAMGTVTNILNFIVLSHKTMRALSTTVYLVALATADLSIMYLELFRIWFEKAEVIAPEVYFTHAYCKCANYLNGVARDYSNWLIACLTAERLIVVLYPHDAKSISTITRARCVVILLLLVIGLLRVPDIVFTIAQHEEWWVCWNDQSSDTAKILSSFVEILVGYCAVLVVFIINLVLIGFFYRKSLQRKVSTRGTPNYYQERLTRTLLLVAAVFLVCETPRMITAFVLSFSEKTDLGRIVLNATYVLSGINHACNFFIYVLSSPKYRKLFLERFQRRGSKVNAVTGSAHTSGVLEHTITQQG